MDRLLSSGARESVMRKEIGAINGIIVCMYMYMYLYI